MNRKKRNCLGCGKDISFLPNRAIRCKPCSKKYNRHFVMMWKRKNIPRTTPKERSCARCGVDISKLHYLAEICTDCRKHNKKRVERDYYWKNKELLDSKHRNYYYANKERILEDAKRKRHYRHIRDNMIEVVVAVTCVICDDIIIGRAGKKFCASCKSKWDDPVPKYVLEQLRIRNSFEKIPEELVAWKRIVDLRKVGYQLQLETQT